MSQKMVEIIKKRSEKEKKKQFRSMKEDRNSSSQIATQNHSRLYPTPHEQRGKDRNIQLPLQKHYPRKNPIGP